MPFFHARKASAMVQAATRQSSIFEACIPMLSELEANATASRQVRSIPIYREIMADLETPVSAYFKLSEGLKRPGFILESVEGGIGIARYSFLCADPVSTLRLQDGELTSEGAAVLGGTTYHDPLESLKTVLETYVSAPSDGLPTLTGGAVGYVSYDAITKFEPRVGLAGGTGLGSPEAAFHVADTMVVFDHIQRTMKLVAHVPVGDGVDLRSSYEEAATKIEVAAARLLKSVPNYFPAVDPPAGTVASRSKPNTTPDEYREMIARAKQYILDGDIFQVVLSQRVDVQTAAHPFTIYRALRTINPSPYMFFLDFGDHQVVGASPELLVRLEDGVITNHPIAGTRPRGADDLEDRRNEVELLADEKERAEHIMLVDLGRNDVGRVSFPGTVHVPKLMEVEKFSHVMHIVSHVQGKLDSRYNAMSALRACFPAGTVSGAPKIRAMEIIAELEKDRRGIYSGAVGYLDFTGGMDTCIALRTLVYKDGVAALQAGGGVVADSTPEGEYAESHHKMRALVRAIERAEEIERNEAARGKDGGQ